MTEVLSHTRSTPAAAAVRCRLITRADIGAVADLLKKGFGAQRSRQFWLRMLDVLESYSGAPGLPKLGYLLESGSRPVGALLLISSTVQSGATTSIRVNPSSWYVEPEFRPYGSLLSSRALAHRGVTYFNISPAPHTWPILDAQGYRRYAKGLLMSAPMLSARPSGDVEILAATAEEPGFDADPFERDVLRDHARFGCISVWCRHDGRVYPFVFRRRLVWRIVPCFQLVYCRDIGDFVRFARPLGTYLARRGRPLVLLDANGPVAGLFGRYFDGVRPKYFKGPNPPRLGDLAYTEASLFGV